MNFPYTLHTHTWRTHARFRRKRLLLTSANDNNIFFSPLETEGATTAVRGGVGTWPSCLPDHLSPQHPSSPCQLWAWCLPHRSRVPDGSKPTKQNAEQRTKASSVWEHKEIDTLSVRLVGFALGWGTVRSKAKYGQKWGFQRVGDRSCILLLFIVIFFHKSERQFNTKQKKKKEEKQRKKKKRKRRWRGESGERELYYFQLSIRPCLWDTTIDKLTMTHLRGGDERRGRGPLPGALPAAPQG